MLEVENLQTEFHLRSANVKAVDGVSFSVAEGECVGLVGESGCGKSTTGLSIMKLLPSVGHVTGGSVKLLGRDLLPLPEREMRKVRGNDVSMIFQDPMTSLNPTWTVGRQIAEAVRLHRDVTQKEALAQAREVLELVGMPRPAERLGYYPHQLSGGLRQRVMIAMALACSPKLLIADEPTTALDVTIQAQILDLIDGLRRDLKMAVILITHDLGVIAARANRVMVMYAGKIVEGAGTDELFASMRHPYTEALFRSIPRLDHDRSQALYSIPGMPAGSVRRPARLPVRAALPLRDRALPGRGAAARPETSDGTRPGAGAEHTDTPAVLGANPAGDHVFACFHPVRARRPTRGRRGAPPIRVHRARRAAAAAAPSARCCCEIDRLVKEFPVTAGAVVQRKIGTVKAVSDVSFSVRRGETFGLVGESGCGKTTIGWLIVALHRATAGIDPVRGRGA